MAKAEVAARNVPAKIVVVTGAGGRFGQVLAQRILDEPLLKPVFLTSDVARFSIKTARPHKVYQVALKDPNSVKAVFSKIHETEGDIDILINNAAVTTTPNFRDYVNNSDDVRVGEAFAVNCAGALYCIKYTLNRGRSHGKKIINVLAGRALTGHTRHVEYYASKAGLYNATRTLARDYPNHFFRNIMTGRIAFDGRGDRPESIWAYFRDFIYELNPPQYREVYFKPRLEYLTHLLRYYADHFRSCERRPVERL